jgi:rRNA-processing protein FCF1
MEQALLDTNFILTCVKQKIDFFEDLDNRIIEVLIPTQVIKELESVAESKKKLRFREDARLALRILKNSKFKEVDFESKKHVDKLIVKHAKENPKLIIATLDREIKDKLKKLNPILVIREKKRLEIR